MYPYFGCNCRRLISRIVEDELYIHIEELILYNSMFMEYLTKRCTQI